MQICANFEANMKLMRKIGVSEYTKTCKYEANKIHIRFEGNKKSCEYGAPYTKLQQDNSS